MVVMVGEINSQGAFKYVPNKRLNYFLKISGGLTPNADRKNIWVEYPDGRSSQYKKWDLLSPKIYDGSKIIVGKVEEREPVDTNQLLNDITSIVANLAQALAVIFLARN